MQVTARKATGTAAASDCMLQLGNGKSSSGRLDVGNFCQKHLIRPGAGSALLIELRSRLLLMRPLAVNYFRVTVVSFSWRWSLSAFCDSEMNAPSGG